VAEKKRTFTLEFKKEVAVYFTKESGSGHCLDNAVAERFFRTIKNECIVNWRKLSAESVRQDIVEYIEMFYNSQRLHSYFGYCSPDDYEKREFTLV
jgi:putative transposase